MIGQLLPAHPSLDVFRPLPVIDLERDPVIVAKIEFGLAPMQVPVVAMLVHASNATLEDREHAFNGVGVDVPARPAARANNIQPSSALSQPILYRYTC